MADNVRNSQPDPHDSRAGQVQSVDIAIICAAISTVVLRLISRRITRAGLWYDDYAMIIALPLALALPVLNLVGTYRDELPC